MSTLKQDTSLETNSYMSRRKRIRRLVIMVLLISVGVHIVAGIGAGIWVVARYFAKPEAKFVAQNQVEIKPEERRHRESIDQLDSMRARPVLNNRIQSLKPSALVLPDLPKIPLDAPIPITAVEAPANIGSGNGQFGAGNGNGEGFFGGAGMAGSGLLEGTFYDLKQTRGGAPTDMTPEKYPDEVRKFLVGGWSDARLSKYFRSDKPLYTRQVFIPTISADAGPKAFHLADKVKPKMWIVHYQATVRPTATGQYRFVGRGDDVLVVRFNHRVVLDGSLKTMRNASGWKSKSKPYMYPYTNSQGVNLGDWINVKAGESYPMEILIGERPGGDFKAYLFIEDAHGTYHQDAHGNPILPLFRLSGGSAPKINPRLKAPPFDPSGPVWETVKTSLSPGLPKAN